MKNLTANCHKFFPKGAARQGVTLLELLVVLAILGTLATLTLAGYTAWRRKAVLSSLLSEISLRLREARNFAVEAGIPSVVFINSRENEIRPFSFRPALRLSFDSPQVISWISFRGKLMKGRLGKAALLDGSTSLDLSAALQFIPKDGLALSLLLLPLELPPEGESWYLIRGGERFGVLILSDGALRLKAGDWEGRTRSRVLVPGRWQEIVLTLRLVCGESISLSWEGIPLKLYDLKGKLKENVRSFLPQESLFIGPLRGLVDEVVLYAVTAGDPYGLPGDYFILRSPETIHFSPRGTLHPLYHERPAEILIAPSYLLEKTERSRTVPYKSAGEVVYPNKDILAKGEISKVVVDLTGRIRIEKSTGTLSAKAKKERREGLLRK